MESLTLSTSLSPHCSSFNLRHSSFPLPSPSFSPSRKPTLLPLKSSFTSKSKSNSVTFHNPNFELSQDDKVSLLLGSASQGPSRRAADGGDAMGLLLRERIVFLGNEINDFIADGIISQLLLLDAQDPTKDIRLFINSPGGSLSASMAIYDVVQLVRADVSTVALGISSSTASIVLCGGTKGKRFAMPNARTMIHQPLGSISGEAADVEVQSREIMNNKDNVIKLYSKLTGRSYKQVEKDIDRDRYMSPIEAVEYGLIDGVIDRDRVIPLIPVPQKIDPAFKFEVITQDLQGFINPDIPDDEIY